MNTNTNSSITNSDWLKSARYKLCKKGIDSANLDSLMMLESVQHQNRSIILANPDSAISQSSKKILDKMLSRRLKHEPMAYIFDSKEFYGRVFIVDKNVLVPRPESESFIDLLKTLNLKKISTLVDVGSGSGCIGISAKLEFPNLSVDLLELSDKAIEISKINAKKMKVRVNIIKSDLLPLRSEPYDIVIANLPYVPNDLPINIDASFEPRMAIFGGIDGLNLYKDLWKQIGSLKRPPAYVLTESLEAQHTDMLNLAKSKGYKLSNSLGLVQLFTKYKS